MPPTERSLFGGRFVYRSSNIVPDGQHLKSTGLVDALKHCIILYMTTINPWINFNGNAEEAFTFYKSVFGGEFTKVVRFKDVASAEFPVEEKDSDKVMRISLPIGGRNMLIGNDVPAFMGTVSENENRSKIHVDAENKEEALKIFEGLSHGGEVEVPFDDGGEEVSFAMFRDKYGVEWIVEFDPTDKA